jgi:hypothetical protein
MICLLVLYSCSTPRTIRVHYMLPEPEKNLTGKSLLLSFNDNRVDKSFLSPDAKRESKILTRKFLLIQTQHNASGKPTGPFSVTALFAETFKRRMNGAGIAYSEDAGSAGYELVIGLEDFYLDNKDRRWMMRIQYTATLKTNRNTTAVQTIKGSAERLQLVGRTEIETLIGELLTDVVNQLNLAKLFQDAGI